MLLLIGKGGLYGRSVGLLAKRLKVLDDGVAESSFDAVRYLQILMAGVASWKVRCRLNLTDRR
jgi:hypothetical protein